MDFADVNLTLVLVLAIVVVLVFGRFILGMVAMVISALFMACLAVVGGVIAVPVLWVMARMSDRRDRREAAQGRADETRRVREQFEHGSRW